jgi:uncharacterized SAM-binding protein YcdF (DUF218 family)
MSLSRTLSRRTSRLITAGLAGACAIAVVATAGGHDWRQAHLKARTGLVALLAEPLEQAHERSAIGNPATLTGVVVLGGGRERLKEAGRLARRLPHIRVFVSGAGPEPHVLAMLGEGIARKRISIETISRSTRDNAVNSRRLVAPRPGERWLLVTSAVHMPRSMAAFERAGFRTEPWPVDDLNRKGPMALQLVAHEWLGIAWYWLRARRDSLIGAWLGHGRAGPAAHAGTATRAVEPRA